MHEINSSAEFNLHFRASMSAHGKAAVRRADDHAGSESLVDIAVVPEGEGSWVIRMNCGPRGCSPATLASTVPPKGTRAWLANTKMAVARVAAPDWSCAGSRGGGANPRHRASGCRRHTAGLRYRACASAGH